jgi:protein-L-isoaspartate(D-aspartate) O-methyltransferase
VSDSDTHIDLDTVRQYYAEELRAVANLQSETLVRAFAKVPREHFLGPGPWQVRNPDFDGYWMTKDADPRRLYHNILVAIDPSRHLNNGHPSFLAFLLDELELQPEDHAVHVGCGTGYYTAVMAEVVGRQGHVTAIEVDHELAARARRNLSYLPHVRVLEGNGSEIDPGPCDAILINAGTTHPQPIWVDSLELNARLLLMLTVSDNENGHGFGGVLKVKRKDGGFAARFISRVGVFPCIGVRDLNLNERLKVAFERGNRKSVQSLRRDSHNFNDTCWLHTDSFCLSTLAVPIEMGN